MSDIDDAALSREATDTINHSPLHHARHGSNKLRITSVDLTPDPEMQETLTVENLAGRVRRMTRLDSKVTDFYDWIDDGKLGTGNFSVVKRALMRQSGQHVAIKVVSKNLVKRKDRLIDEIRMLKDMAERPHIIQLYDVFENDDSIFLVMQLAEGGELFDRIVQKKRFPEPEAMLLIRNLLLGVNDLHQRGIIHRDLKPENILMMSKDTNTDIAISDFGLSKYFQDIKKERVDQRLPDMRQRNRAFTCCGTDIYMAPEVLSRGGYSFQADLWSVGVILYCVLAGYPPFYHERDDIIKKLIARGEYEFYPEEWDVISNEAKDVVRALLVVQPERRATAERALAMPWFHTKF